MSRIEERRRYRNWVYRHSKACIDLKPSSKGDLNQLVLSTKNRFKAHMDTRTLVIGQAGIGKSYFMLRYFEEVDPNFLDDPIDAVEHQVCFEAKEYLKAVTELPKFSALGYDEPGQTWHHREFMSEANIILSKTMIGYRFKKFATCLCIPNINMIDKDARELCQFMVNILSHGRGEVFKILPQKFGGKPWFETIIDDLKISLPSVKLRHAYEKKKQRVQDELYDRFHKILSEKQQREITNEELLAKIMEDPGRYWDDNRHRLHVATMQGRLGIGRDRAERLRAKFEAIQEAKKHLTES